MASEVDRARSLLEGNPSPARRAFSENATRLRDLLRFFRKFPDVGIETEPLRTEAARIRELRRKASDDAPSQVEDLEEATRHLEARVEQMQEIEADYQRNVKFLYEWHCVMLVTFTESYLQDALAYFANLDRGLMGESAQLASYDQIIAAGSLEEIAAELRHRWARNFIESGGPHKWLQRLQKMGASSLSTSLLNPMEDLWGIRHLVVHRAGKIDSDFRRRHSDLADADGRHIELTPDMVALYTEAVRDFVIEVDMFLELRHTCRKNKGVAS
jgi:hypothetical protein